MKEKREGMRRVIWLDGNFPNIVQSFFTVALCRQHSWHLGRIKAACWWNYFWIGIFLVCQYVTSWCSGKISRYCSGLSRWRHCYNWMHTYCYLCPLHNSKQSICIFPMDLWHRWSYQSEGFLLSACSLWEMLGFSIIVSTLLCRRPWDTACHDLGLYN